MRDHPSCGAIVSADVIEQMLETTRRTTNIASRLVQSLEFRNAARPSAELGARIELAKILRDSMLRKLDELEQLVKNYRIAEKRIGAGESIAVCPPHVWGASKIRGAEIVEQTCDNCGIVEVIT